MIPMTSTPLRTLADLFDVYEQEILPTKAPGTAYVNRLLYKRFRNDKVLGALLLSELTSEVLRDWRNHLSAQYRPNTVRRYLYALQGPLTLAVRYYDWIEVNPMGKVQYPSEPEGRVRFLSPEERTALLLACRSSLNPHLVLVVELALMTGGRKQELMQLCWHDVDLVQGHVRFMHTKNKIRRAVPVLGAVLEALRVRAGQRTQSPWVFPRVDGLRPIVIEGAWQVAKRRAWVEDLHFHDLRHTFASYMAMSGASLLEIATLLGHKSLKMVQRYSHLSTNHLSAVVERMRDKFLT